MTERGEGPASRRRSLRSTLLLLIAAALLAGVVPAGVLLDRRLASELEDRVRAELARAPSLLLEHHGAVSDAMMMYAKELSSAPGLAAALARGDRAGALRAVEGAQGSAGRESAVMAASGEVWLGPRAVRSLARATRRGEMPVAVVCDGSLLRLIGLAPVERDGVWIGAAGVVAPLDRTMAAVLAGITRSDLVFLGKGGSVTATVGSEPAVQELARLVATWPADGAIRELELEQRSYLATTAQLDDARVVFLRDMDHEMAVLPQLRRVAAASAGGALALALLLGALLATRMARPAQALAEASDRLARGDFDAPLPASPIRELDRVSDAFGLMRRSLAARLRELEAANLELAERQERLTALQSEVIRRERFAVGARLVGELAHEIRNPIANLRNCLELLERRLQHDEEGREFAALAIDELLRMHELAERMLDLNRPRDPELARCDAVQVAADVVTLARAGRDDDELDLRVCASGAAYAAIAPDALKQVLLNLVQNAREARAEGLIMEIGVRSSGDSVVLVVADNGPGIPHDLVDRVFEPFVTTRRGAGGAGLGLFVVEGTLRRFHGRITLSDDAAPPPHSSASLGGARFRIELPAAPAEPAEPAEPSGASEAGEAPGAQRLPPAAAAP